MWKSYRKIWKWTLVSLPKGRKDRNYIDISARTSAHLGESKVALASPWTTNIKQMGKHLSMDGDTLN